MKVLLLPNKGSIEEHNGIGRVVHAQYKYLPKYGIEFVEEESQADLVVCHTHQFGRSRVDVVHLHGLYWTGDHGSGKYDKWHYRANKDIIASVRRAISVTVPTYWVGEFLRRDFRIQPTVIGHGINLDEWTVQGVPGDYGFWAKNRDTDVCDPEPFYQLARAMPETSFVSTFAPDRKEVISNLKVVGRLAPMEMADYLKKAGIYVATTPETWGITTAEALACGVPVLGYRWGGTEELVEHGKTGWLVEPGDIQGLVTGFKEIMAHRQEYTLRCVEASQKFGWETAIKQYVQLYEETLELKKKETYKVSIVITNYNYSKYLKKSVASALNQEVPCEVVVVDDGSTDDSLEVLKQFEPKIKVIKQKNQGVAAARTRGIQESLGDYIICLDADDELDSRYVPTLLGFMINDRGLGIAYTGLSLVKDEDTRSNPWPPHFTWEAMTTPTNPPGSCIHSAAMFRREMWRRAGNHRQAYAPAEDTEFWVRGLSVGFTAAKITDDALFKYTIHENSASRSKVYNRIDYWYPWMRDKIFPSGAPIEGNALVKSYNRPVVTVVVDGDNREQYTRTIESLIGQTYREWEVIVVSDYVYQNRYPFIRRARSKEDAVAISKGKFLLEAKAGTVLPPETLYNQLKGLAENRPSILIPITEKEGKRMPCSTCGGGRLDAATLDTLMKLKTEGMGDMASIESIPTDSNMVRMQFIGDQRGATSFGGSGITASGNIYRGGNNAFDKYVNADPRDVEWLIRSSMWAIVPKPIVEIQAQSVETVKPEIVELVDVAPPPKVEVKTTYRPLKGKK